METIWEKYGFSYPIELKEFNPVELRITHTAELMDIATLPQTEKEEKLKQLCESILKKKIRELKDGVFIQDRARLAEKLKGAEGELMEFPMIILGKVKLKFMPSNRMYFTSTGFSLSFHIGKFLGQRAPEMTNYATKLVQQATKQDRMKMMFDSEKEKEFLSRVTLVKLKKIEKSIEESDVFDQIRKEMVEFHWEEIKRVQIEFEKLLSGDKQIVAEN